MKAQRTLALTLTVVLALVPLMGSTEILPPNTIVEPTTQALVAMNVNNQEQGDVLVIIRGNNIVGIDTKALISANVPIDTTTEFMQDEHQFAIPAGLGIRIQEHFDPKLLTLSITVRSLTIQSVDMNNAISALPDNTTSAILNYDLSSFNGLQHQLALTTAISSGPNHFLASDIIGNSFVTPTIYVEHDNAAHKFTYRAGSFSLPSDSDFSGVAFVGIDVHRDFSLTPLQSAYPTAVYSGVAAEPSIADVYIGGILVREVPLAPGPFALTGVGDSSGSNVRIVLRNNHGVISTYNGISYSNIQLLAAHTFSDSFSLGRDTTTLRPIIDGTYRLGLTNQLTAGAHFRSEGGGLSSALSSDFATGPIDLHAAVVKIGHTLGYSSSISYVGSHDSIGLTYAIRPQDPSTITNFTTALTNLLEHQTSLSATHRFGNNSQASAQLNQIRQPNQFTIRSLILNASTSFRNGLNASFSLSRDLSSGSHTPTQIALQLSMTRQNAANTRYESASINASPNGSSLSVRSAPIGGIGSYSDIRLSKLYSETTYGYNSPIGTIDGSIVRNGPNTSLSYDAQGSIGYINHTLSLAQKIDDGYVLVNIPGVSHLPIYIDGRRTGYTNTAGQFLVGGLTAYAPAVVEIHATDLPLNVSLDSTKITIVTGRHGGAVANFVARIFTQTQGHIANLGNSSSAFSPAITFQNNNHTEHTSLDEFHSFTTDRLSAGPWSFVVSGILGVSCHGSFEIPTTHQALLDVGNLTCQN